MKAKVFANKWDALDAMPNLDFGTPIEVNGEIFSVTYLDGSTKVLRKVDTSYPTRVPEPFWHRSEKFQKPQDAPSHYG